MIFSTKKIIVYYFLSSSHLNQYVYLWLNRFVDVIQCMLSKRKKWRKITILKVWMKTEKECVSRFVYFSLQNVQFSLEHLTLLYRFILEKIDNAALSRGETKCFIPFIDFLSCLRTMTPTNQTIEILYARIILPPKV